MTFAALFFTCYAIVVVCSFLLDYEEMRDK